MPGRIFISYRRDDVPGDARGLRDGLAARFGKSSIFMDVDNLLAGQRFDEELAKALKVCDVFLAVIGPRWMEQLAARTMSGERDYVREEIAAALKRSIVVIPVRVGREGQMPPLPRAGDLPEDIRDLVLYQKQDVAHERFGRDIAELAQSIVQVRKAARAPAGASGRARWLTMAAGLAALAIGGGVLAYQMGVPMPWDAASSGVRPAGSDPDTTGESKRAADAAAAKKKADDEAQAKRKADEAERQRLAMLKAEEEEKRAADETRRKADAEAKARADAEVKRKAEEAERQRLAMLKVEEDRKRAEAEAKRKAEEEATKRLPRPGQTFRDCPECPEMVVVPAGEFMMGSPAYSFGDEYRNRIAKGAYLNEMPEHKVRIATSFAVGRFEVTFAEWDACVSDNVCLQKEDQGWGRDNRPVINVSWDDIAHFYLPWLNRKTGKTYRLLTEAEWEYAARGGSAMPYAFGYGYEITKQQAQFSEGSKGSAGKTVKVGTFAPNGFGLHDMHGNVREWVADCYKDDYRDAPSDGRAVVVGVICEAVVRGGSWYDLARDLRSATRHGRGRGVRGNTIGFRVGRTLTP